MKSFKEFKKDLSEMDRSVAGPAFIGTGVKNLLRFTKGAAKIGTTVFQAVKNKFKDREDFDRDIEAYRRTIDPKTGKTTLSPEDQKDRIKTATTKHPKFKEIKVKKPKK